MEISSHLCLFLPARSIDVGILQYRPMINNHSKHDEYIGLPDPKYHANARDDSFRECRPGNT
jgi:hypothetical protein